MVSTEKTPDGTDDKAVTKLEIQELSPSNACGKTLQEADTGIHISQLDKDGSISSITPSLLSPCTVSPSMPTAQEGKTPLVREKGFEDGYRWRKYGQKLVKGNEFVRSYYKCTHPSCVVKKQLERSHSGQLADIVYFGEHVHPKPVNNVPMAVGFVLSVEERPDEHSPIATKDKSAKAGKEASQVESTNKSQVLTVTTFGDNAKRVLAESNKLRDNFDSDADHRSKRQKKNGRNLDPASTEKLTVEPRFVVQTLSEVNIVDDGYRWRKYGQKMVKGNPNPRSYYRCSTPACPAKKHVERASHDQKLIITSYEGRHDHDMPPSRIVTHNATGAVVDTEPDAECRRNEVHDDSTPESEPILTIESKGSKQTHKSPSTAMNNELISEGSKQGAHSSPDIENESWEQQNCKSSATEEKAQADVVSLAISSSVSNGRLSEKQNSETKAEPRDEFVADRQGVENDHHIPKSETVNT